jgi:hypothetical protein
MKQPELSNELITELGAAGEQAQRDLECAKGAPSVADTARKLRQIGENLESQFKDISEVGWVAFMEALQIGCHQVIEPTEERKRHIPWRAPTGDKAWRAGSFIRLFAADSFKAASELLLIAHDPDRATRDGGQGSGARPGRDPDNTIVAGFEPGRSTGGLPRLNGFVKEPKHKFALRVIESVVNHDRGDLLKFKPLNNLLERYWPEKNDDGFSTVIRHKANLIKASENSQKIQEAWAKAHASVAAQAAESEK